MCMNPAPPERGTRRDPAQRGGATLSMTGFLFCLAFAVTLAWAVCPWLGGAHLYRQFVVATITLHGENNAGGYRRRAVVALVFAAMARRWQGSARPVAAGVAD